MKKFLLIIYLILLVLLPRFIVKASQGYARITTSYAYLYKTASKEIENNIICYLEETYFVFINLDYNEEFYKVTYNNTSGYVLKDTVTKVYGTPTKPNPTTKLTTISNKCYLRSTPKITENNIITVITENCTDLEYIGKIYGEEAIDYQGNLWYLVNYYGVSGYIYSKYISYIRPIAINNEIIEETSNNLKKNPTPLTNLECGIIITILTLPIIFVIFIMYQKPKISKNITNIPKTRKLPKTSKVDYDNLL